MNLKPSPLALEIWIGIRSLNWTRNLIKFRSFFFSVNITATNSEEENRSESGEEAIIVDDNESNDADHPLETDLTSEHADEEKGVELEEG